MNTRRFSVHCLAFAMLLLIGSMAHAAKPRLIVTTDIGGDPDDTQSMVRLMVYANEFDIEGLIASASGTPGELSAAQVRPDLIQGVVDAYGQVRNNLAVHAGGYPTAGALRSVIKAGNKFRGMGNIGSGHDTEGSNWIISVVDRSDSRPVHIAIWGGQTDLAQALWKMKNSRSSSAYGAFVKKMRVHDIADQDGLFSHLRSNHPDLWYVLSKTQSGDKCSSVFRGMFLGGDTSTMTKSWIDSHIRNNHGALGAKYPKDGLWTCNNGINGIKEGDTPSWFYFLPHGVNDPTQPGWGGFGGRFQKEGSVWRDAQDTVSGETSRIATVWRWRPAYQNDFRARMDWCVASSFGNANHAPVAVLNGQAGTDVMTVTAAAGTTVALSANGSSDPDGNSLSYRWWQYREADSTGASVSISGSTSKQASFTVPNDSGKTVHIVLEVADSGAPKLTSFRRLVVQIVNAPTPDPTPDPDPVPATKILSPGASLTFAPGQQVTAKGDGANLVWGIDRLNDGKGDFASGTGSSITFTVPADSTADQFIRVKLTGDGGSAQREYDIVVPSGGGGGGTPPPPALTQGLIAHWTLDDGSGTSASDVAGNNASVAGASWESGHLGLALHFNGVDDHVQIPHRSAYLLPNGTVSFWFKSESLSGSHGLFSKDSNGYDAGGHMTISTEGNQLRARLQSTSSTTELWASNLQTSRWYHVAVVFGSGGMKLYLDGAQADSNAYSGGLSGNEEPIVLGVSGAWSDDRSATPLRDFFKGLLDDVRIYDKALSGSEIAALTAGSAGGGGSGGAVAARIEIDPYDGNDWDNFTYRATNLSASVAITRVTLAAPSAVFDVFKSTSRFSLSPNVGGNNEGNLAAKMILSYGSGGLPAGVTDSNGNGSDIDGPIAGMVATVTFSDGTVLSAPLINVGDSDDNDSDLWVANVSSGGGDHFVESGGLVVMEAESFTSMAPGSGAAANHTWSVVSDVPDSGAGLAVEATPNVNVNVMDATNGPRLDYQIQFQNPGTYYVWVRMLGLNGADDSLHAGLDGVPVTYGGLGMTDTRGTWHWEDQSGGQRVTVQVGSPGVHTFHLWMREDGVIVDKIILTQDPNEAP